MSKVQRKSTFSFKTLAPFSRKKMYKHNLNQLDLPDFVLPFQGELSRGNKWVKMAALIPWDEFEERYRKNFSPRGVGAPALSVRTALAALTIKEELRASDRAAVEQITENPYLQYFCGLKEFITAPPFDASMFVHFRKRFPADVLNEVNNAIAARMRERENRPSPQYQSC